MIIAILLTPDSVFSDGAFISTYEGNYPEIPIQRAIVKYSDGVETLVVESAFKGEGTHFGWIIPLPAVPFHFEELNPGFLTVLSRLTQLDVYHDPSSIRITIFTVIFLSAVIVYVLYCKWSPGPKYLALVGASIAIFLSIPHFQIYRGGGHSTHGVKIVKHQVVGNFNITVIEASKSDDLNAWLAKNGYSSFTSEALVIIDDYIDKNWCFVAAKLIRSTEGILNTHPILMEFRSKELIYPMRLTSIAKSETQLELFVIAAYEATTDNRGLERVYANQYVHRNTQYEFERNIRNNLAGEVLKELSIIDFAEKQTSYVDKVWSHERRMILAGPDARKLMWNGCVLTKFTGTMGRNEMASDIVFGLDDTVSVIDPYRKRVWSFQMANLVAGTASFIVTFFSLLIFIQICFKRKAVAVVIFLLIVLVPISVFSVTFLSLPEKTEVVAKHSMPRSGDFCAGNTFREASRYFAEHPDTPLEFDNFSWRLGPMVETCAVIIEGDNQTDFSLLVIPFDGIGRAVFVDANGNKYTSPFGRWP